MERRLLIVSDLHIRFDAPVCRKKDEFPAMMKSTLQEIANLAKELEAILIVAGDIFDVAKPANSQELEVMLYEIFKGIEILFVCGQHDLLYHRFDRKDSGSIGVVERFDNWRLLTDESYKGIVGFSYGQEIRQIEGADIMVAHKYCQQEDELPFYLEGELTVKSLMNDFDYKLNILGDNHHGFVSDCEGRIVVNSGCITRQSAELKSYKPFVTFVNIGEKVNEYKQFFLPDDDLEQVDDSHLQCAKERQSRIDHFLEVYGTALEQGTEGLELDLKVATMAYLKKNKVKQEIKEELFQIIEMAEKRQRGGNNVK